MVTPPLEQALDTLLQTSGYILGPARYRWQIHPEQKCNRPLKPLNIIAAAASGSVFPALTLDCVAKDGSGCFIAKQRSVAKGQLFMLYTTLVVDKIDNINVINTPEAMELLIEEKLKEQGVWENFDVYANGCEVASLSLSGREYTLRILPEDKDETDELSRPESLSEKIIYLISFIRGASS